MATIIGNTTATPYPRPDWNQTDETKADYIKNKPTDYIVEQGASDKWTFHKWTSGIAECWGTFIHSSDEGIEYPSTLSASVDLPFAFSQTPEVTFGINDLSVKRVINNSGESTSAIQVLIQIDENYPLSAGQTISLFYNVKGKWIQGDE